MNPEFGLLGLCIFGLAFCGVCFIGVMSRRRGPPSTQGPDVDAVQVGVFSGDMRGATSTQVQRAAAFAKLDYFTVEKPKDDSSLGVDLKIAGQMALVLKVAEGSLSEAAGLQPGLRIYTVNGRACDGADHCAELLRDAPAGSVRIGTARIIVADSFDAAVDELKHGAFNAMLGAIPTMLFSPGSTVAFYAAITICCGQTRQKLAECEEAQKSGQALSRETMEYLIEKAKPLRWLCNVSMVLSFLFVMADWAVSAYLLITMALGHHKIFFEYPWLAVLLVTAGSAFQLVCATFVHALKGRAANLVSFEKEDMRELDPCRPAQTPLI